MKQPQTLDAQELVRPDIDFSSDDLPDLPAVLKEIRGLGRPVVPVKTRHGRSWLFLDYDVMRNAFIDQVNFDVAAGRDVAREVFGYNMQMMRPDEHRMHRALVAPTFTPAAIRRNVEMMEGIANEMLDRMEGLEEVDFLEVYAKKFPFTVITRMLGIPVTEEDAMVECALNLLLFALGSNYMPTSLRARKEFDRRLAGIIADRRVNPRDDLISELIQSNVQGKSLDDEEILAFCRLLFPAGSDTTYKAIGSMLYHVLPDEALRARAMRSDEDRMKIVEETLRLYPPVGLQGRTASGEVTIGDAAIRPGDTCMFGIAAANRDERYFPDPDTFNPDRNNNEVITFGRGPHFCLGLHLARQEMRITLKVLLERFPDICLSPDHPPSPVVQTLFRGPRELWVKPYGRK